MAEKLIEKVKQKLDRKSEKKIANEWARAVIPGGAIEKYNLYHSYIDSQPEMRKKRILEKFNYFTRVLGE